MIRCEVSIVSLMQQTDVLNRIVNSKSAHDKALSAKLLKMAAVLQQVQAAHGAFAPVGE